MTTQERAIQIYQVLIGAAHNRQIITYQMLGKLIGVPARGLAGHLGHILVYCERHALPALTALVVKTHGGKPGEGFPSMADLDSERERVFAHEWYRMKPVTAEELRR